MINWSVVWAIVVRHLYNFRHSYDRIADAFYWPAMNILLWGFTTVYVANAEGSLSFIVISVLSGIILWMLVWRSQYEITVNLLEEMWNVLFHERLPLEMLIKSFVINFILLILGVWFFSYMFNKAKDRGIARSE